MSASRERQDALLGVADAGEVGDGRALAVGLDLLEDFKVLADIAAACAVGAGDVVGVQRVELFQHAAFAAQLFHADVGLRGEYLERECVALFKNISYAHGCCLLKICVYFTPRRKPVAAHSDTTLSYHNLSINSSGFLGKRAEKFVRIAESTGTDAAEIAQAHRGDVPPPERSSPTALPPHFSFGCAEPRL